MNAARPKTILLVDDDAEIRDSLRALLERERYVVYDADGGDEALRLLTKQPIQLVISDHQMPGMSGIEFLKLIRERYPHMVRIMLTGDPNPEVILRSINEGEVYRFIRKPWDAAQLRAMIHSAFELIQLEAQNRRLIAALRRQMSFLQDLQHEYPRLSELTRDDDATLLLAEAELLEGGS